MFKKAVSVISLTVFLTQPIPAFAQHGERGGAHGRGRGGFPRGEVVHRLPPGYISLLAGGLTYLFCEGLFYRYTPAGYVVVAPPPGAVVPALPPGYTTVYVNRVPYYEYGYTYYSPAPNGYVVTAPPAVPVLPAAIAPAAAPIAPATTYTPPAVPQPAPPNSQAASANAADETKIDTFEIHIPNGDGSFTLITLKKTGTGFLGPQGEFYPDHPTVDQLKERYIKNKVQAVNDSKDSQL